MKKFALLAAAALMASTVTAYANEFAGPRVEARLGMNLQNSDLSITFENESYDDDLQDVVSRTDGPFEGTLTSNGVIYGLGAGYDFALSSKLILGVEANLDLAKGKWGRNLDPQSEDVVLIQLGLAGYIPIADDKMITKVQSGREIDLSVRAGYVVAPSTLVYVKGGYVNARDKFGGFTILNDGQNATEYEDLNFSKNRGGYRIGAGLETKLNSNLFLKAEYRYSRSKTWKSVAEIEDYAGPNDDILLTDTYTSKLGGERHQALIGVGFRF